VDNRAQFERLLEGTRRLGIEVSAATLRQCLKLQEELLRWNRKVNLTAIVDPDQVLEKHLLDSLAAGSFVPETGRLIDLGAGAGFPSIPLALYRERLEVVAVDAVGKKVGFIKHASAQLGLGRRLIALHRRAEGDPEKETIPRGDVVISRALMDLGKWLSLARHYTGEVGRVVAMLGRKFSAEEIAAAARDAGAELDRTITFALPFSGAERTIVSFRWHVGKV